MVFDPAIAPRDRGEFMAWYRAFTQWGEDRDYNAPEGMTGALPAFFEQLRADFPPMNGPFAVEVDPSQIFAPPQKPPGFFGRLWGFKKASPIEPRPATTSYVTDYSLGQSAIYMAFSWSVADIARIRVIHTARITGVGFFDVSAHNGAIMHDEDQFEP